MLMWGPQLLLFLIIPYLIGLVLIIGVSFIGSKLIKKGRPILIGVLTGGSLSVIVLTYLWYTMITDQPDAYEGAGWAMFLFGQPLSWIFYLFEPPFNWMVENLPGNRIINVTNLSMILSSVLFLLNWCGIGAFVEWLIQRKRCKGEKINLDGKVGQIPHHNI